MWEGKVTKQVLFKSEETIYQSNQSNIVCTYDLIP